VAITSQQFLLAAKDGHKFPTTQTKKDFQTAHQILKEKTENLISVVAHVAGEIVRVQNELNNSIEQIRKLKDTAPGYPTSTPVDVIYSCNEVLASSSEIIYAQSQSDTIKAAKNTRDSIEFLINAAKTVAKNAPESFIGDALLNSTFKTADELCKLLEIAKLSRQDPSVQTQLQIHGEQVTTAINSVVASLRRFPNATCIQLNDNDLDSQAIQELMKCQQIVGDSLRSILPPKPGHHDRANSIVVETANAVGTTTSNLIQAALRAYTERVKKQKIQAGDNYTADPIFINGLVSSAQNVTVSMQEVTCSTNNCTQTNKPEGVYLVASATAVGQSASGLSSKFGDEFVQTAKSVSVAVNGLIRATKLYTTVDDSTSSLIPMTKTHVDETDQWVKIIRLERELEQERKKAEAMKQTKAKVNNRKTLLLAQGPR